MLQHMIQYLCALYLSANTSYMSFICGDLSSAADGGKSLASDKLDIPYSFTLKQLSLEHVPGGYFYC